MATFNKERYDFIERMIASIHSISIATILGRYVNVVKKGRHYYALCPFHGDTKLGSLVITPDTGIYKCFTCGHGGDAIKFVADYKNCSYLDAAFDIALDMGLITSMEYDKYSRRKYDEGYVKQLEKKFIDRANKEDAKPERARKEVIHNVYLSMQKMCPLSEEHMKALKEKRHLSDERIAKDYFTCPVNWKQIDNIIAAIREKYPMITDDELKKVPGFFFDTKKNKIRFSGYKGLCLLIRDCDGVIRGVQIRRDTIKEGEQRYVWVSSAFAFYKKEEGYEGGCGSGSPKDVLYPKVDGMKATLCLTEGKFKSEILAQSGNTAISMQGVSAWKGIIETIGGVLRHNPAIRGIYIFLDSDILGKHMLFEQSKKMCAAIVEAYPTIPVRYAFWRKEEGKGIDDYIIAKDGPSGIKYVDWKTAVAASDYGFKKVCEHFGITSLSELSRESAVKFEEALQVTLQNYFMKKF